MQFKLSVSLVSILALGSTFLLLTPDSTKGQTVSRPERGGSRVTTYEETEVDRVDLRNGNLFLAIPLASLPAMSGGRIGMTVNAHYNSKLWDSYLREEFIPGAPDHEISGPPTFYTVDVPKPSHSGGWRIGERYELVTESASSDFVRSVARSSGNDIDHAEINAHSWHKTFLVTPDGSRHELRPIGLPVFAGSTDFYRGYQRSGPNLLGRPIDYHSFDGTFLRVRIFPTGGEIEWRVLQMDGVSIEMFRDGRQRISDSNGNSLVIFDEGTSRVFKDEQTGREVRLRRVSDELSELTYRTVGGGQATISIHFRRIKISKLFEIRIPASDWNPNGACTIHEPIHADFKVVDRIRFPQTEQGNEGRTFHFEYKDGGVTSERYLPACSSEQVVANDLSEGGGELAAMKTPNGSIHSYRYHLDGVIKTGENTDNILASNTISSRSIDGDGDKTAWHYSFGTERSLVEGPDGTVTLVERYPSWLNSATQGDEGLSGLVYRETIGNHLRIERRWRRLVFNGADDRSEGRRIVFNPVVAEEYRTIYSSDGTPSKTSATIFEHDFNGNVISTTTYDWFETESLERDGRGIPLRVPEGGRVLSRSAATFHHSPMSPDDEGIYHSNPSRVLSTMHRITSGDAVEEFAYDGNQYSVPPHKGNLTRTRRWSSTDSEWVEEHLEHDESGNIIRETDAEGHTTVFTYDAGSSNPTSVTRQSAPTAAPMTERFSFDSYTGLLISATDANGHQTIIDYWNQLLGDIDPYGRPGKESRAMVTIGTERQSHTTRYIYEDSKNRITTESDALRQADGGRKIRQTRDGRGRTILIERNEAGSGEFRISARIIHSPDGRVTLTENPRRIGTKLETDGWTRLIRDPLGRNVRVSTFAGRRVPSFSANVLGWSGDTLYSYDAERVTITDQTGRWTRRYTDSLGRLTQVEEPADGRTSRTESSFTRYSYDLRGNLLRIEQGDAIRDFEYDSLSRLIRESSPESGQSSYRYDRRGNRTERRDSVGIRTRYFHDGLGRLTAISYSSQAGRHSVTPDVLYRYDDPTVPNSAGRLTSVTSSAATRFIDGYDELGRLTSERLSIGGAEFSLGYEYSLGGQLSTLTLPSGKRIESHIDASGEVRAIDATHTLGSLAGDVVSEIAYHPSSALAGFKRGNNLWETHELNARLQPVAVSLGRSLGAAEIYSLENHYRPPSRRITVLNNGNIHRQVVVRGGEHSELLYTHDSLNRVSGFQLQRNGKRIVNENYGYDRNGNPLPSDQRSIATHLNIDRDAAGNLITGESGVIHQFDAENRLVGVNSRDGTILSSYDYDGEGRRTSKTIYLNGEPKETFLYIHDSAGRLISEYSSALPTRVHGRRLHLTKDHLESVRLVTDDMATIISQHDFEPFGNELHRSNMSNPIVRFAGHDKDPETGFHHAQARTFSPAHRGFLSADPITVAPDRLMDPQRLNRFSYVRNSPLSYSDPTGEDLHIKITNIVIGYQYLVDLSSGRRIRTEVMSYRVLVTNDSGTRRIFELTRGSSHGNRGQYARLQEAPPGEYTGKIRSDGRRGFRIELTEPGQPDGQMTTPDSPRNRGNIQLHRNGLYVEGCMTFPISDYGRFEQTITRMLEQDRIGGFGTKIFVSLVPRNRREGASDLFIGDPKISLPDLLGDENGTRSRTKAEFDLVIPSSPSRLQ